MSIQHWKNVTVPEAGDDLLAGVSTLVDTAGVYVPAASVAAARAIVAQAVAKSAALVTVNKPLVFLITGIFYVADGTKTGSVYNVVPANGASGVLYTNSNTFDGAGSADSTLFVEGQGTINLPAPTLVELRLDVCVSGESNQPGSITLGLRVDGTDRYKTELAYNSYWVTQTISWRLTLAAGSHTVAYTTQRKSGARAVYHYGASAYAGRRFTVTSLGLDA